MQLSSSAAHLSQNIIPPLFRYQIHKSDTSSAQSSTKLLIISVKTMLQGNYSAFSGCIPGNYPEFWTDVSVTFPQKHTLNARRVRHGI